MSADAKETIYLFTTTVNSLYKRDLLNVCCLPEGWTVEFGYKNDYVPSSLSGSPQERLDGHPAVIVFCEPVNEGDVFYRYYPVRKGVIGTTHKDLAGCLTVPITLDAVFNYSADELNSRIEEFQTFVAASQDRPQTLKSERMSKKKVFVRSASDCFKPDHWKQWAKYWYPLSAKLGSLKGLDDSYFIRLECLGMKPTAARGLAFPAAVLDGGGRPKWRLTAGRSYDLRIEVRPGHKAKVAKPVVVTREETVYPVGPFERQSGDGTEVEFLLSPKRTFQAEYSLFEVRVDTDKEGKARSAEVSGVLEIAPTRALLTTTILCLVFGTAFFSLDSVILEEWFGKPDGSSNWHGKSALVVAKLNGALLVAVGAFLGFRRLPIKT